MKKLKNILINLSISFLTILFIVLVGEIFIRYFTDIPPPLMVKNIKLGDTYRKNTSTVIFAPESKKYVSLSFNNEGFRGPSRDIVKPNNTIRIAILGDSQIAAIDSDVKDTFVHLLEQKLNHHHPERNWEVLNFGVSGASTAQELNLYKEIVRKYKVDIVVCAYLNANDFSDNSNRLSRYPRIYMDFKPASDQLITLHLNPIKNLSKWLNENSRFYVWQKHAMKRFRNNFIATGLAGKNTKIRGGVLIFVNDPGNDDLTHSWRLNDRLITEFNQTVNNDGSLFIFVSIPHAIEFLDPLWNEFKQMAVGTKYEGNIKREHPQKRLSLIVAKRGIRHLFLKDIFEAHTRGLNRDNINYHVSYNSGSGHLNEIGNHLMTNSFYDYLKNNGIIMSVITGNTYSAQILSKD